MLHKSFQHNSNGVEYKAHKLPQNFSIAFFLIQPNKYNAVYIWRSMYANVCFM